MLKSVWRGLRGSPGQRRTPGGQGGARPGLSGNFKKAAKMSMGPGDNKTEETHHVV